jgi:membrane-associated phospholipid phosphatase
LAALLVTAAAVITCYFFVDRPVAFYVHANLAPNRKAFDLLTHLSEYLFVVAAVVFVAFGLRALVTSSCQRWHVVLLSSATALAAAETIKDELKFVFGRTWPETWTNNNPSLIGNDTYGFNPFHGGSGYSSFPSGHTTAVCAVAAILWFAYPRLRVIWTAAVLAVAVGLIGADYHFVSDIIAGAFLGASTGWVAVIVWDEFQMPRLKSGDF